MRINESVFISNKPESIWDFWMNVSNDVQWRNGIIKAEWTSQPPYGNGSTGEHTHKNIGAMQWKVTKFEPGSSFEFIHTAGSLKGSTAYFQVVPENSGSRVNLHTRITGPFIIRFMMLFMGKMMRNGIRGDLQKLKSLLEK